MRKGIWFIYLFFILVVSALTLTTCTYAAEKGVLMCVQQKFKALRGVNPGNAQAMLYRHFSVSALAIAAYGGGAKWKANPQDHQKVLNRFKDKKRIGRLAKALSGYKSAKAQKVTTNQKNRVAIVIASTKAGPKKVTIVFAPQSCTVTRLCVDGAGCAHQLFQ